MINVQERDSRLGACIIIILRFITPIFTFLNPFTIPLILKFLDFFDYSLIYNSKLMSREKYQRLDKLFDLYYLTILFVFSIYWNNYLLIGLYIFRLIGFILFSIFKDRRVFVLFPNIFEVMFNIYSFGYVYDMNFVDIVNRNIWLFLMPVVIWKIIVELYVHYFNGDSLFFVLGIFKKRD